MFGGGVPADFATMVLTTASSTAQQSNPNKKDYDYTNLRTDDWGWVPSIRSSDKQSCQTIQA
jgi:hypothetical protein